jgi:hypothetical protein
VAANFLVAPPSPSWPARAQSLLMPLARRIISTPLRSVVFGGRVVLGVRT